MTTKLVDAWSVIGVNQCNLMDNPDMPYSTVCYTATYNEYQHGVNALMDLEALLVKQGHKTFFNPSVCLVACLHAMEPGKPSTTVVFSLVRSGSAFQISNPVRADWSVIPPHLIPNRKDGKQ